MTSTDKDIRFQARIANRDAHIHVTVYEPDSNGIQVSWYSDGPTVTAYFKGELLAAIIEAAQHVDPQ